MFPRMLRASSAAFCLLGLAAFPSPAQEPQAPLPPENLKEAIRSDALSIPTAGEFMAAMDKVAKTNWQMLYRKPIPTAFSSRAQNALNLGGLIADGYLAVEAEDSQQVKNIGKDVVGLAKALGVSEQVISRGNSITEFAEKNEWNTLKEELEATQNEVKLALADQQDEDLICLVTVGAWIRGLETVSSWIDRNYAEEPARLLRQPAIVRILRARLDATSEKSRDDKLVKEVRASLKKLEDLTDFPADGTPDAERVKKIYAVASELSQLISSKP
jgi:hypothetical protein